ncbi:hypothetical protein GYMLUDRAFT_253092 [Collybiopsis luxurians FD-317 M1]|uniref:MYND-type domain-containing protein n=1 Tax=Collybiopsis luxurians FD-317 M1 TaxID=944289 RepID=A0A0D0BXX5_9AGAR|nr:hypothetical protein GYMLUDRAFT_253092 [Collybiopsis luxurians FD-317 M1]
MKNPELDMDFPSDGHLMFLSAEATGKLLSILCPPAPPSGRHPGSDPNEPMRKQLKQCSECWKSHTAAKPLRKCSGCRIETYCSAECQRKAWPRHKAKCKRNIDAQRSWNAELHDISKALSKFTAKHRPVIAKCVVQAFKLRSRPQQVLHEVLVIHVSDRRHLFPTSRIRPETSFYVVCVSIYEIARVGPFSDILQREVIRVNVEMRKKGLKGAVFVLLICGQHNLTHIFSVGFDFNVREVEVAQNVWQTALMSFMNNGIIM